MGVPLISEWDGMGHHLSAPVNDFFPTYFRRGRNHLVNKTGQQDTPLS